MRFLVDECTGPHVARWLRQEGHEVLSIYEKMRGCNDRSILRTAVAENRILVTNDKDFGERVVRERMPHKGVVLLRLEDERVANKIRVLRQLLRKYGDQLTANFVVTTDETIRIARGIARE